MTHVKYIIGICVVAFASFMLGTKFNTDTSIQSKSGFPLLEVPLAKQFPIPSVNTPNHSTSSSVTNIRVPVPETSAFAFLSDYEVTLESETGDVAKVSAVRGFQTESECYDAMQSIMTKFSEIYPEFELNTTNKFYSETVGDLYLNVTCYVTERSPYFTFEYSLESNAVADKIIKKLTQR